VRTKPVLIAALLLLCARASPEAHHSFVVEYDINRPLTLTGVVSRVEWTNPHATLSVDVADRSGTTTWIFQLASPNVLERGGWTRRALRVGERVVLQGYGGFAVATRGVATSVTLPDGRVLVVGPGAALPDSRPGT
jgi:DNA/RNA endonuclease YhcR with UshA esterase domain